MTLKDKIVFITGGGGGIGSGMAQAFAEEGARIVLADINPGHAREEAAKLPTSTEVLVLALDVTALDDWTAARARVEDRFGTVDILCNNAGISGGFRPLAAFSPEDFARLMEINVTGVYNGIHSFAPAMTARGSGHIVNTSSTNGLIPFGSSAAYSASKFAVLGLSDALRDELALAGVGVSTLFPGLTRSRMSESSFAGQLSGDPERAAAIRARMMDPLWIGRAVVRAVRENQRYIVTHPAYRSVLEARNEKILAAFGEPAQPGYVSPISATRD